MRVWALLVGLSLALPLLSARYLLIRIGDTYGLGMPFQHQSLRPCFTNGVLD